MLIDSKRREMHEIDDGFEVAVADIDQDPAFQELGKVLHHTEDKGYFGSVWDWIRGNGGGGEDNGPDTSVPKDTDPKNSSTKLPYQSRPESKDIYGRHGVGSSPRNRASGSGSSEMGTYDSENARSPYDPLLDLTKAVINWATKKNRESA